MFLTFSSVAQANAGTPLMWASALHLLFGNLIIGLAEGWLLAKICKLKSRMKTMGLLIVANYFSAWIGSLLLSGVDSVFSLNLYNAWPAFWGLVVVTYLITLILEFPFVVLAFRGIPGWFRKAIRGSLVIQTASYTVLFGWYWLASATSLYTMATVVDLSFIPLPEKVLLYYISDKDGDVYRRSLADSKENRIYDLNSTGRDDRLLVRPSDTEINRWDLFARLGTDNGRTFKMVDIRKSFASIAAPDEENYLDRPKFSEPRGTWFNFGSAPKLGEAESSDWNFYSGFWPGEGLTGEQTQTGSHIRVAFETPFVEWDVRNATHLPTDKVLFQLGENQICLYDPNTRRIALVTYGRGPIAIIDEGSQTPTTKSADVTKIKKIQSDTPRAK
jgi:hypothetical protein